MLAAANERRFSVLYFHSLSRLGRESVITMPILKMLVHVYGIRVVSITDGLDSDGVNWETMATICCLQNEHYIRDLAANVRRGQEGTVLAGFSVGDLRFGYSSIPSPNGEKIGRGRDAKPRMIYVIDEEEAVWVRRIFEWFVGENRPIGWIVKKLNAEKAPTDHRSTTKTWSRAAVIGTLRSPKYTGLWSWGKRQNVRNPLSGMITQVDREDEEIKEYLRDFRDLRIIDDDVYRAARERLDQNSEDYSEHRVSKGRLSGSPRGRRSDHLLSGQVSCHCGRVMYVGGSNGKYLFCRGARDGLCEHRTQLPRDLAEQMILDAIGRRIVANPVWIQATYDLLVKSWEKATTTRPAEITELEALIRKSDIKISRLLNQIEVSDVADLDVSKRLRKRREEKQEFEERLARLKAEVKTTPNPPTYADIQEQVGALGKSLRQGTSAVGKALRDLLVGPIALEEIIVPGRKRCYWRGRFRIPLGQFAKVVDPIIGSTVTPDSEQLTEEITLDFKRTRKWSSKCDEAWALYEQCMPVLTIAKSLGISKSKIGAVLDAAAAARGISRIDGRRRRHEPGHIGEDTIQRLNFINAVKRLWDEGLENQQIADRLGVCRDTVTKAIRDWHKNRELPVPDGRSRRWGLSTTNEPQAEAG